MINFSKTALLATLLIPSAALAQINLGDQLGTSETAIRAALEAQGYTVSEFEAEDQKFEVDALINGQSFEFEVSQDTGLVLAAYLEDDENGEEEEDDDASEDD